MSEIQFRLTQISRDQWLRTDNQGQNKRVAKFFGKEATKLGHYQ